MKSLAHLSITCINQSINTVQIAFQNKQYTKFPKSWKLDEVKINDLYLYYEQKHGVSKLSCLFFDPLFWQDTTVFYSNSEDGFIGPMEKLSQNMNWEMYYFSVHENDGIYQNGYHFSRICGSEERHLLCYKEDERWVFYEEGEPLPFEDTERYKERLKRKRVDKELLLKYMCCAGWDLEDDRFWQPVGPVYRYDQIAPFGD